VFATFHLGGRLHVDRLCYSWICHSVHPSFLNIKI
jgi:hypothetical protein